MLKVYDVNSFFLNAVLIKHSCSLFHLAHLKCDHYQRVSELSTKQVSDRVEGTHFSAHRCLKILHCVFIYTYYNI